MPAERFDGALGASYELVELLGRGAAGEVWRGVDRRTGETIAAKLLRREHVEDDDLVERFLRERSILTQLRHENVVRVRDLVVEGDRLAIVMEYVDGGSLRQALRTGGPVRSQLALNVTAHVLDGLAAGHDRRVLHRDVKPDNVLLSTQWRQPGPGRVKLSDFGIARILADRASTSNGLVGTPEYMAPEQLVTGAGDLSADVYSAGILLYELLSGRTPFAGVGTSYAVAHRHVTSQPPRLPVPERVWDALVTLIDKDPNQRPTAREAAAGLRAISEGTVDLPPLPAQEAPVDFDTISHPLTEVRGIVPPPTAEAPTAPKAESSGGEPRPDLGTADQITTLRPMPTITHSPSKASTASTASTVPASQREDRPRLWRDPRILAALAVVGVLLIGAGVVWVSREAVTGANRTSLPTSLARAQQQGPARPSGLGISRVASWDPQTQAAQLSITYSAQRSPLRGPFLEVLPGADSSEGCPAVEWQDDSAEPNLPTATGIDTSCSWSVDPPAVPAKGSLTVSATVPLRLQGTDPYAALQGWLDSAASGTEAVTTDNQVSSTAYPAQRLTDIEVRVPPRTVSETPLRISLIPVWPSGSDELNPLFQSTVSGEPSSILVAVAAGVSGVRFSDGCSGALSVSREGLEVTAQSVDDDCRVNARVGNFTDLVSNSFTIVTRGS